MLAVASDCSRKSRAHTVDIVLVNLSLNLEVGEVVDLSDVLTSLNVLTQFHVKQSQFAVNSRAHLKLVLALAHEEHVLAHIVKIVLHLRHLHVTIQAVLLQALAYKTLLAQGEIVVLAALQVDLLANELLLVQT